MRIVRRLPYAENFEGASDNGWSTLLGNYFTSANSVNDWMRGAPSKPNINGAHMSNNAWVTKLTGNYSSYHDAYLVSPVFDFSAQTADPILSFWHHFRMYDDIGYLEISTNGGSTWTKLDNINGTGTNNNTTNSVAWYSAFAANFSGNSVNYSSAINGWVQSFTKLTGAAGQANVRFRFYFRSDAFAAGVDEGWAIDDVQVSEGKPVVSAYLPTKKYSYRNATLAGDILYRGSSAVTMSGIVLHTSPNPQYLGTGVTSKTTAPLVVYDTFSFSNFTGLTPGAKYYYRVFAQNASGIAYSEQDSFTTLVPISTLPYLEDFDANTPDPNRIWKSPPVPSGVFSNDWVLGSPNKRFMTGAYSGSKCWVTNESAPYRANHQGQIESPQFDFSGQPAVEPILRFRHKFDAYSSASNPEGGIVLISINGGAWTKLDNYVGGGSNFNTNNSIAWYNSPYGIKFSEYEGSATYASQNNGWIQSQTRLTGANRASDVRIAFHFFSSNATGSYGGWAIDDIEIVMPDAPTVIIPSAATSIFYNQATLSGNITTNGGATITANGFVLDTVPNPVLSRTGVINATVTAVQIGAFNQTATGLKGSKTYYYRAYAINGVDTSYSADSSFTTNAIPVPTLVVPTVSHAGVSYTSATLLGRVTAAGTFSISSRGFVLDTIRDPDRTRAGVIILTESSTSLGDFNLPVTGLLMNKKYYFKAFAINNAGGVGYSAQDSFTTAAPPLPSVSVGGSSGITSSQAILSASNAGSIGITASGIVVGTSPGTDLSNAFIISPTSPTVTSGTINQTITGLTPNTTYYFKGYSTNMTGTGYSSERSFTTTVCSAGGSINGGSTICSGSTSGVLTLSGHSGNVVNWESSTDGGFTWTTISNTTTTYNPGALIQTTQYRAVVQNGSCSPATSVPTTVTVNPGSVGGTITVSGTSTICSSTSPGALNLNGHSGSVLRWEISTSPFTSWSPISNTSVTYTPSPLAQTTRIRALVQNGSCSVAYSDTAIITVISSVGGTISGGSSVCSGSTSGVLTLGGYSGTVQNWESSISPFTTWTPIANTAATYTSGVLTQTTRFRVVVQNGSCAVATSNVYSVGVSSIGQWLGTASSDWNDAANWCGGIPISTTNVTINAGTTYQPLINSAAEAYTINIGTGASLGFTGTGNRLSIYGTINNNNGTFNAIGGKVVYAGTGSQQIFNTVYDSLTIEGGASKSLYGDITVNKTLTLSNGWIYTGTGYNVTIGSTGSINGGSATSFISIGGNGKLIQMNIGSTGKTGAILFPVGSTSNPSYYTPIYITNTGTSDNFSVSVAGNVLSGGTTGGSVLSHVVMNTWAINEDVAGGSNATLSFQWNASNEQATFNRSSSTISHFVSGTTWQRLSSSTVSGTNPYTQSASGVTNFGLFAVSDMSSSLPVTLTQFTTNYNGKATELIWQTASEINNSHFDIERSIDGKTFVKVGERKGAGSSNSIRDYQYTDTDVTAKEAFATTSVIYYRLKQVDFDGKYTYSEVRTIMNEAKGGFAIITVQPNPFTAQFTLSYSTSISAEVTIDIIDVVGKNVYSGVHHSHAGINQFELPGDVSMKDGVYFVRITNGDIAKTVKVMKQH